ncbi:hypothetical protein L498_0621, partial [Bordetella holmesii CDC-H629-BH]
MKAQAMLPKDSTRSLPWRGRPGAVWHMVFQSIGGWPHTAWPRHAPDGKRGLNPKQNPGSGRNRGSQCVIVVKLQGKSKPPGTGKYLSGIWHQLSTIFRKKKGSSRNTGECRPDLEEEVLLIAV